VKNYAKLFLRELGYELKRVSKTQPSLITFLQSRAVDLVVDVGANQGQFGKTLRKQGYGGEIISFEPVRQVFTELQKTAARYRSWRAFNFGLSDRAGKADINVSEMTEFSSLHRQTVVAIAFDARARVTATERIELRRVDELSSEFANRNVFLKIDTQGHEKQVLDGAGALLETFCGVQLELPTTPLYQSIWTIGEAVDYMKEKGFVVCQIAAVNKHKLDPAALVDVDVLFRHADPRLDGVG